MLKASDVEGLSWLINVSSTLCGSLGQCQRSGRPGWWFPCLKRGTRGCVLIIEASHYSASLGKYTLKLRCWKGGSARLLNLRLKRNNEESVLGMERQTRTRILEGAWEYAYPVHMCFVDLEKVYDQVPREILWEVLREYRVRGSLLRASYLFLPKARAVSGFSAVSRTPSQSGLASARAAPYSWTGFQGAVVEERGCSLVG